MAFVDPKRTQSAAYKYSSRISAIEGARVRVLWEGASKEEGEREAERLSINARHEGSNETIVLDTFRLDLENRWVQRSFSSRPPSVTEIRRHSGKRNRPRILYMPLEFPAWTQGASSWSYAAGLAYAEGLRRAGCEVTTINTACATLNKKIIGNRRYDQVWLHCHPRHLDDFSFRQWIADIAPVRLLLCGETIHYPGTEDAVSPWLASHRQVYEKWEPFITHAAFVDPADIPLALSHVTAVPWMQAVPEKFVLPVNERPARDKAVFVGTLYPPRDRWAWELAEVLAQVDGPESDAFQWLFEKSHEWIQSAFNRAKTERPWWCRPVHGAYNRLQTGLRRHAFGNFLAAIRDGVAVVSLPSQVKTYSGRVVEGMAAGRPVITQRIPGQAPIFEEETEILHYDSAADLENLILRLKANPNVAIRQAQNARAAILRSHTVEIRTQQLLDVIDGKTSLLQANDASSVHTAGGLQHG